MENSDKTTFHIGICMAGAISAGAYTAGVMDYLLESLEHWEKAKRLQEEGKLSGIPKHSVLIDVLGGASAGGMTAAITSAALQQQFESVKQADLSKPEHTKQNPLFNAWVNLTETKGNDMMTQMLATDDIEQDEENQHKEVRAGLNSSFIKTIANNLLDKRVDEIYRRPYVADNLDVFTTITNLRGYNYNVIFETSTGPQNYTMKMHRDYAFFKVGDDAYENDGRIPVSFKTANNNEECGKNITILKQAAMSTGAFPVGLESRTLNRQRRYIEDSKYLNLRLTGEADHRVDYNFLPDGDFESLNVDGGVINNEPFEVTQQLINDRRKKSLTNNVYEPKISAGEFDSTVLMIDPFPSDPPETGNFVVMQAWKKVLPSVLSAMIGQLRLKESEVKRAYLNDDYTRFLIAPSRTLNGAPQPYTIACGSLGGFGGFFAKSFREHDFLLGRRNCQRFLQHHFSAPKNAGNPILAFGYSDDTCLTYASTNHEGKVYLPLIPDLRVFDDGASGYKVGPPDLEGEYTYPSINLTYILDLKDQMAKRLACVAKNISNPVIKEAEKTGDDKTILGRLNKKSKFQKLTNKILLNPLKKALVSIAIDGTKGVVAKKFSDAIIGDMDKRGLINDDYTK